jgi:carbonic anhydrase/acetyltransferase-like protein (isoleucine patch superfamily)
VSERFYSLDAGARPQPKLGKRVFVAKDAWVIDQVELGDEVTVLFGAVLRGDILPIRIGARSNVQDRAIIHTSHGRTPSEIGSEVTIGHGAIIHGAKVGDRVLVGMGSILLDQAVIAEESVVGAGSLVTEGKQFPPRSLILGSPAKVVRQLNEKELEFLKISADRYAKVGLEYHQRNAGRGELWNE